MHSYYSYKGAVVEVRCYNRQYFISINGDAYPYGLVYTSPKRALAAAKRRIDKGDFETSKLFLETGSHSLDDPSGWRLNELRAQRCQYAVTWRRVKGNVLYQSTLSRWKEEPREIWLNTGIETYNRPGMKEKAANGANR